MASLVWSVVCLLAVVVIPMAVIVGLIGRHLRSASVRGLRGERMVARALRRSLDPEKYTILHDLYLPATGEMNNGTTQIDHLVVSQFGLFCIETKNLSGAIYGREREAVWTQKVGRQTYRFQNPLRQNYLHASALASFLRLSPSHIHSVVVFAGTAVLKTPMPPNVVRGGAACVQYIKQFSEQALPPNQAESICLALTDHQTSTSPDVRRAHVAALKRRHEAPREATRTEL